MARRFDIIRVDEMKKNTAGVLTGTFFTAQTGVFPYMDYNQGKVVMELKHPDHLLSEDAVNQLKHLPITDEHPWGLVNLGNSTELVKGLTGSAPKVDGEKLVVDGAIFDSALAAQVMAGQKSECSLGFECDLVEESGEYNGQHYDRIQTNYRFNHLAMVPEGRCGPECKAVLDNNEPVAVQVRLDGEGKPIIPNQQRSDQVMKAVKIDGKDYQVPDEVAARFDTLTSELDKVKKDLGKVEGERDAEKAKVDAKQVEIDTLKENPSIDQTKIDQAVSARINLVADAAGFGVEVKLDGTDKRTDRQIKVDCIKKVKAEFDDNGKTDEYVAAFFDSLKELVKKDAGENRSVGNNSLIFNRSDSHQTKIDENINKRQTLKKS